MSQLGGLMSDFFALMPRVSARAITVIAYIGITLMVLYLFVIHGWAFMFVRAVQKVFLATFVPNSTSSVSEL